MKLKYKSIKNMRPGDRFIHPGHSSLMIMTDLKQTTNGKVERLATSENGLTEWLIASDAAGRAQPTWMVLTDAKQATLKLHASFKKALINKVPIS